MSVDEAINIARVAIHKYFLAAQALPKHSKFSDIEADRNAAIAAIHQFSQVKRDHGEHGLSPYEERSLQTFDAAEVVMMTKLEITEEMLYGGACHAHC